MQCRVCCGSFKLSLRLISWNLRSIINHLQKNGDWMKTVCSLPGLADENSQKTACLHAELTFIILARTSDGELATSDISALPMIGDVNVFFNGTPGESDFEAEAEIMIAGELTLRIVFIPYLPLFSGLKPINAHMVSCTQNPLTAEEDSQVVLCN